MHQWRPCFVSTRSTSNLSKKKKKTPKNRNKNSTTIKQNRNKKAVKQGSFSSLHTSSSSSMSSHSANAVLAFMPAQGRETRSYIMLWCVPAWLSSQSPAATCPKPFGFPSQISCTDRCAWRPSWLFLVLQSGPAFLAQHTKGTPNGQKTPCHTSADPSCLPAAGAISSMETWLVFIPSWASLMCRVQVFLLRHTTEIKKWLDASVPTDTVNTPAKQPQA